MLVFLPQYWYSFVYHQYAVQYKDTVLIVPLIQSLHSIFHGDMLVTVKNDFLKNIALSTSLTR